MYMQPNLTRWQRLLEWCFPWRRHVRERAQRETLRWLARKIDETESEGSR